MSLQSEIIYSPRKESSVVKWLLNDLVSRGAASMVGGAADAVYEAGTVLGRQTLGAPVAAAKAGMTGNGTITALALAGCAVIGCYSLVATGANAFAVFDPAGKRMSDAVAGTPYTDPALDFTVTEGTTPFVAGDTFVITVPRGTGQYVPLSDTVFDGSHIAQAVLALRVFVAAGDQVDVRAITDFAVMIEDALIWPADFTASQIADGLAQLERRNIFTRPQC